jgi:hypothetical protein
MIERVVGFAFGLLFVSYIYLRWTRFSAGQAREVTLERRVARLEHLAGLASKYPFDVRCPTCEALPGAPCSIDPRFQNAHGKRFDVLRAVSKK